ncbi:MAG: thioredoxin family protein [Bacteroidota bacterium]
MKTLLLWLGLGLTGTAANLPHTEVIWHSDFQTATQLAEQERKPIFMVFSGSDWCKPCIRLEKDLFSTPEFQSWATENLVLLKLDFPRRKMNQLSKEQKRHNSQIAMKYNPQGSFPLMVLLNPKGEVIWKAEQMHDGLPALQKQLQSYITLR